MVDKNINIIYQTFGAEQVAKANQKIAQSFSTIRQQGKVTIRDTFQRDDMGRWAQKSSSAVEDTRARFKMWMLSVMFFGMMIQRTFQKMEQTTLSTFMKITEAQTTAGQAVSMLSAHWEYLKFSVGEAIAQFIEANPWIVDLIDRIADFVQQNGKLIATLIIGGIVAGTFFMSVGQLGLGINGLTQMFKAFTGIAGVTGVSLSALVWPILIIIAAVGLLYAAWQTNFLNIRQITGTIVMGLQLLWDSGLKILFKTMGDGVIFLANIFDFAMNSLKYVWEAGWLYVQYISYTIWNGLLNGIKIVYDGVATFINGFIWLYNQAAALTRQKPLDYLGGLDISKFMVDTSNILGRLTEINTIVGGLWNQTLANTFSQTKAWETALEGVSPALKSAGLAMIQSGVEFNVNQETAAKQAAGWTPAQIATGGTAQTVNISNNINVDKMSSDLDIDKLTKDISSRITDSLKSYGIGG